MSSQEYQCILQSRTYLELSDSVDNEDWKDVSNSMCV